MDEYRMSPQARRRLLATMQEVELSDLATEIVDALNRCAPLPMTKSYAVTIILAQMKGPTRD